MRVSFQLNHYENTITQSQRQAGGDTVSMLPLDNRAHRCMSSKVRDELLERVCVHMHSL